MALRLCLVNANLLGVHEAFIQPDTIATSPSKRFPPYWNQLLSTPVEFGTILHFQKAWRNTTSTAT